MRAQPLPSSRPVVALRTLIWRRTSVLLLLAAALMSACLVWFGVRPLSEQLVQRQFDAAVTRVEAGLADVFQPTTRLLGLSRNWLAGVAPDLDSPDAFNAIFKPVLIEYAQLTSVVAGSSSGQGWLLLELPGGGWRNRMTDVAQWGTRKHLLIEQGMDDLQRRLWGEQEYDPRNRPWYLGAITAPTTAVVHWTAPYTFFTTGDPGITASTRMRLNDGRDLVLGFDLTLRDLSRVTLGAQVGRSGLALVLTEDERVLALPQPPAGVSSASWLERILKPVSALGLPALTEGLAHWHQTQQQQGDVLRYDSGGQGWLITVRPYQLGEQRLLMLVMAPQSDFAPDWQSIGASAIAALAVSLALALWLIRLAASRLSQPLEELAHNSQRIGQLDFEGTVPITSQVTEISALAESLRQMQGLLRDNQRKLDTQAQELVEQVHDLGQVKRRLQTQNDQLTTIIENFPGGVSVVGPDMRLITFNTRFKSMMGLPESLLRKPDLLFEDMLRFNARRGDYGLGDVEALVAERMAQVQSPHPHRFERILADGTAVDIRGMPMPQGGFVTLYIDVTAAKAHERELEHLAHFDALTGLPNRVLLADRLRQAMVQASRRSQQLAVAYLDLDGFKFVNDAYGHEVGDQLLLLLAGRMKAALREGDTLARLGGDEFVAILIDFEQAQDCLPLLSRLLAAADAPASLLGHALQVSASIGVTFFPQAQEVDAEQLLRQADQAMYQAKQAGKNQYHMFDAVHDIHLRGQLESLQRIGLALQRQEFVLYYQPKVNLRTGAVVGAEALIRWQHPERGLLAPGSFLPLVEDHALAVDIGQWVLQSALAQMVAWQEQGLHLPVSVNVGARQLQQADFVHFLRACLASYPSLAPADLQFEVLETSALEDIGHVTEVMAQCRALGVTFALDDFGTGYSSLTYLKRLAVAQLKVDQSFVRDMLDDPDDLSILVGVLDMSASFQRQVIAEGVETSAHGRMLLRLGCELAQGYGIARPMPAQAMPAWCQGWTQDAQWQDVPVVSKRDLPILFASAEHRAWVAALQNYLTGRSPHVVALDAHRCNVGQWIDGGGLQHHPDRQAVARVVDLHGQIHAMAQTLCQGQAAQPGATAVQAQLPQLLALRDQLLDALEALLSGATPG